MSTVQKILLTAASKALRTTLLACLCGVLTVAAFSGRVCAEPQAAAEQEVADLDFQLTPSKFTIGARIGWVLNRSDSEIHDFLREQFTLQKSDFDGLAFSLDVAWRITSWVDVVGGFELGGAVEEKSEYRDFVVEGTRAPIKQELDVFQMPLTLSLRFYPLAREREIGSYALVPRRIVPYLGGGIGGTYYSLKQKGDFVDFVDDTIFKGKFKTQGWDFSTHVFAGGELFLTGYITAVLEARYQWASADVGGDYVGFDSIDLDGLRLMAGIHLRI